MFQVVSPGSVSRSLSWMFGPSPAGGYKGSRDRPVKRALGVVQATGGLHQATGGLRQAPNGNGPTLSLVTCRARVPRLWVIF